LLDTDKLIQYKNCFPLNTSI